MNAKETVDVLLGVTEGIGDWMKRAFGKKEEPIEPFIVNVPPGAKIRKHDETGLDVEVNYGPEGKWFWSDKIGAYIHILRWDEAQQAYECELYGKGTDNEWLTDKLMMKWDSSFKQVEKPILPKARPPRWKESGESEPAHIVDNLLEDSPFAKTPVELEYRPVKRGDEWKWFWVLHSEDRQRAVAHGQADSRAEASTQARLRARQLKSVIIKVTVAPYAKRFGA
jgi:hypothetical protein